MPARSRPIYTGFFIAVLLAGLASRRLFGDIAFVRNYVGDALWALMVFMGIALVFNRLPTRKVALAALLFSFGIELSQLYHAPWIDSLRHTTPGGLVLGFSFVRSDLLCYAVGVLVGVLVERWWLFSGNHPPAHRL